MAVTRVREDGVVGNFGSPETKGPFPGVLALGGSDGGTPNYFLELLVPEGFACLALTYWGTPDTQAGLSEVPLERIERGLRWLADRGDVASDDRRLGLIGASRGGELALLVASTFPDLVGPVVAYTPSNVVWAGMGFATPPGTTRSSWTREGQPLPWIDYPADVAPVWSERGASLLPICARGLDDEAAVERAAIGVERATGPLLLVSGGDDRVWPTARMCEMIVSRMARHGKASQVRHLHFPHAGHMLFPYTRPADSTVPTMPVDLGGSAEANADAHAAAWRQVVAHLRTTDSKPD